MKKDVAYLEAHERRIKERLDRHVTKVGAELDHAVSPWMREYPKTGLAAGAVAGLVLGSALAPSGPPKNGGGGVSGFLKGTAAYALRSSLVKSVLDGEDSADGEEPPAEE